MFLCLSAMNDSTKYLKNLPKVHPNTEIEDRSRSALEALLPPESFCLRDDPPDFGQDFSAEVREDGRATNLRGQIQLKATENPKLNNDGSYSLSIDTSNFQYMLNAPVPIYILHDQSTGVFRFLWGRDEFRRIYQDDPAALEQGTVTLRFRDVLDISRFDEIKARILNEGSFGRAVRETILLADSPKVRIEIDPDHT